MAQGATTTEQAAARGTAAGREPAAVAHGGQAAFVELALASAGVVEIKLPNGVRVRVPADREQALTVAIRAAGGVVWKAVVADRGRVRGRDHR